MPIPSARVVAVVVCLACLTASQVRAADEEVPSFKKGKDRETKEFVKKVAVPIVKVARYKPQNIEVAKYEYTKPKEGRTELKMKVNWNGAVTKKKYSSDIVVIIDSSDVSKWEVLNITYKDNTSNPTKPNLTKIQELIPKFNK